MGGDFYDFRQLSSGEWVGVLADVSGKGISAALLSSMVLGALSMELRSGTQPQEALKRVNQLLCEKSLPYQFVTLFSLPAGPAGSTGQFISAGHNPALFIPRRYRERSKNIVSDSYVTWLVRFRFLPGSRLTSPQRGCPGSLFGRSYRSCKTEREEMFGTGRLLRIIQQHAPRGSHALKQKFLKSPLRDFHARRGANGRLHHVRDRGKTLVHPRYRLISALIGESGLFRHFATPRIVPDNPFRPS